MRARSKPQRRAFILVLYVLLAGCVAGVLGTIGVLPSWADTVGSISGIVAALVVLGPLVKREWHEQHQRESGSST